MMPIFRSPISILPIPGAMCTFFYFYEICPLLIFFSLNCFSEYSYSQCIRRAAGYCCVEYQSCPDQTFAFSLDGALAVAIGVSSVDSNCQLDYIAIPGEPNC